MTNSADNRDHQHNERDEHGECAGQNFDTRGEFEAHIHESVSNLMAQGYSAEDAFAESKRRFGDARHYLAACELENPVTRRMRVQLWVAAGIAGAACIAITVLALWMQEQDGRLLMLQQQMQAAQREASEQRAELTPVQDPGVVYIDGECVSRPGVYSLPSIGELTVSRLIAASGTRLQEAHWALLTRRLCLPEHRTRWAVQELPHWTIGGATYVALKVSPSGIAPGKDVELTRDDVVQLCRNLPPELSIAQPQ
jgi:hypothetical protein